MSSDWVTAVIPLAGVALGVIGTVAVQYSSTRETSRQAKAAAAAAIRADRIKAVLAFLKVCQKVERFAQEHARVDNPDVNATTDEMWFRHKWVELVSGPTVSLTAFQFADRLNAAVYNSQNIPANQTVYKFINEKRQPFMDAAGEELRIMPAKSWRRRWPRVTRGDRNLRRKRSPRPAVYGRDQPVGQTSKDRYGSARSGQRRARYVVLKRRL
jgi:hypothetical protein